MVRTNVKVWYPECTLGWTSRALQRVWALRQFYLSCLIHSLWMRTTSASAKWWLFEKCSEIRKGEWKLTGNGRTGKKSKTSKIGRYNMRGTHSGCSGHCSLFLTFRSSPRLADGPTTAQTRVAHRPVVTHTLYTPSPQMGHPRSASGEQTCHHCWNIKFCFRLQEAPKTHKVALLTTYVHLRSCFFNRKGGDMSVHPNIQIIILKKWSIDVARL